MARILPALVLAALTASAGSAVEWPTYAGGPRRLFFNPAETQITAATVAQLRVKWQFQTGAIVTASPSVATVDLPGEGPTAVVYVPSWDGVLHALRWRDGTEVWRFATPQAPGVSFPNAASVAVAQVAGASLVFFPSGQTLFAVDARTGAERWHFAAGTGCADPPALCGFTGERNEIESSPLVADGRVFFGMDVNDREGGKGGFFAVDAADGRLDWFFDLESGRTCHPDGGDEIRRYDGYHSEAELGLPAGFLATRTGCDHPRSRNGCGNVWSSAAHDAGRGLLFVASSNCDTDNNPASLRPPPPMPPFDEALFALGMDGTPAWRWRAREVDNADRAYGAVPNLFSIAVDGTPRDVVGVGNKDGTYTVVDRDGVNAHNGVRWDAADPSALPYWRTALVAGGEIGGVIATAAVDEAAARIYLSTAPGESIFAPQRPTVHALDVHSGTILWQNTAEVNADASFAPTSAVPGVVFVGAVLGANLRAYDATDGTRRFIRSLGVTLASAPAVVDGLLVLGSGSGQRGPDPSDPADSASRIPTPVTAFCVPGSPACDEDQDGVDFPEDCDDRDPRRTPGARELPDDAIDQDCDGFLARSSDACLEGGSAGQDRRDLDSVLAATEPSCPCAAYDGTPMHRRGEYLGCTRGTVRAALLEGRLRRRCKSLLRRTTCGRPGQVVCCATALGSGRRACHTTPALRCVDTRSVTRTIEAVASCAASDCTFLAPTTSTSSTTTTPGSTTTSTTTSTLPPSWAALHATAVGPSCGGCHGGGSTLGGLGGLDDCATGYAALVGRPSTQLPAMDLVEPGSPTASWLLHKLDGTQGTFVGQCTASACGSVMPLGQSLLPSGVRNALRAWVVNGAAIDCP